jgi:hypothetical protein
MNQSSLQQVNVDPKEIKLIEFGLIVFIGIVLCLKFRLLFQMSINQDEFGYLSKIYSYCRGTLTDQFQTFHVHFFKWISHFSKNEVTQIIIARSVMFQFFLGTCLFTYLIARKFINRSGALFAVICFLSFSFVIVNGSSFRSDTVSAFFSLFSIYCIISKPQSKISLIIAGIAMALSLMLTIKAAFQLLTIGVIFMCMIVIARKRWEVVKQIVHFVIALVSGYFLFYQFHTSTLTLASVHAPKKFLGHTSSKVIILDKLFPGWTFLELSIKQNFIIWTLLIAGAIIVIRATVFSKKEKFNKKLMLLAFSVPIFSLIFYRNAFPYFYTFILTPGIIFCGIVFHEIIESFRKTRSILTHILTILIILAVSLNSLFYYSLFSPNRNFQQKELLEQIHKIFPETVPYIDGCSMVASFPKAGFFMSSWGMENYLKANKPIIKNILIKNHPLFLLANVPHLNLSLPRKKAVSATNYALFEEDWGVLKSNFLHHWGPIYVAGKQFEFNSVSASQNFEILIPGEYTLEGNIDVSVDGILYRTGDIIDFIKGNHTIIARSNSGKTALRWGKHLYVPKIEPPLGPIFYGSFR